MSDPEETLETTSRIMTREGGLSGLMIALMGGTFATIAFTFWDFIESLGQTIMAPFRAFAEALSTLITGSIGGPVVMLEAAAQTGVQSLTEGLFSTFGIFAYPVTMFAVMSGIWVFAQFWQRANLSPWAFLQSMRR